MCLNTKFAHPPASDTIVFILTLYRTLSIYHKHRNGCAIPLVKIMLRDGIIYFLVIFAANVVTVTLFIVSSLILSTNAPTHLVHHPVLDSTCKLLWPYIQRV